MESYTGRFNGLALCAGIGGLELGVSAVLPSYRTVCYVEGEAYAAACLVARMAEMRLDSAPIWSDLRTFDGELWRGNVDIVTAGYPCQPFSVAGSRRGTEDDRHLWPHVARIVAECKPTYVFLENVPGHVTLGLETVWGELRQLGYRVEAGYFSAAEVGAPHKRERLYILAAHPERLQLWQQPGRCGRENGQSATLARVDGSSRSLAHTNSLRKLQPQGSLVLEWGRVGDCSSEVPHADSERLEKRQGIAGHSCAQQPTIIGGDWWTTEPDVGRVAHGVPARVDRLRALGNAVVPQVAAYAFTTLLHQVHK